MIVTRFFWFPHLHIGIYHAGIPGTSIYITIQYRYRLPHVYQYVPTILNAGCCCVLLFHFCDAVSFLVPLSQGEGAFAVVELCTYTPKAPSNRKPMKVAVKKLKPEIVDQDEDLKSFMAEVWE